MCALGLIGRRKERTLSRTSEESPGSPTGGEGEAQGGERQTEPSEEVTESWIWWGHVGLMIVEETPAQMSIHSVSFTFCKPHEPSW